MIYFGVDPGKSGSISGIWDDGKPFPSMARHDGTEHDIVEWVRQFDLENAVAVLEKVHAMPPTRGKKRSAGTDSSFKFGEQFGFCKGVLNALEIPYILVTPQKWQKAMGCLASRKNLSQTEKKNELKVAAQRLWPALTITHRNADSLLLAEYGRRYWDKPKPIEQINLNLWSNNNG